MLISAIVLLPFIFMVMTSFKTKSEAIRIPPTFFPESFTLDAYARVLFDTPMPLYLINGLIYAGGVTLGVLITSTVAGYVFARIPFPGRGAVFVLVLATMMVPAEVLLIPLYVIVNRLGMFDSYAGLIVPGLVAPFTVFILRQTIRQLPDELFEAARLDGAGHLRTSRSVVVPLVAPGIAVSGFLVFVSTWGALLWPLIITSNSALRTPQVALFAYSQQVGAISDLMAASTIVVLPVLVAFLFAQRRLMSTLAHVALK
jgi:multiple sugar transport system permease protein